MNQLLIPEEELAQVFSLLGQPARLKIVLAIGEGEACVCHLKEALGWRQAYISQQLMLLRRGNILSTRRIGRHIYYRMTHPDLLVPLRQIAALLNLNLEKIQLASNSGCEYIPNTQKGIPS